jgi:uncharacterized cupin superfamily protein
MRSRIGRLGEVAPTVRPPGLLRAAQFLGNAEARLGRLVGLSQFGVNHVTLAPGAISSLRHWHEGEDEFVYVLAGELVLVDETGEHPLAVGDFVGFPAGVANAHQLVNRSAGEARFLAVGTRQRGTETIHYPDDPQIGVSTLTRGEDGERIG